MNDKLVTVGDPMEVRRNRQFSTRFMKGSCPLTYSLEVLDGTMKALVGSGHWTENAISVRKDGSVVFEKLTQNERDVTGVEFTLVAEIATSSFKGTDRFTVTYKPDCAISEVIFSSDNAIQDFTYTIGSAEQHHQVTQFSTLWPKACPLHYTTECWIGN